MAEEMFTAEEEISETQPDGRIFLIAAKGAQIPMAEAARLGLVKPKRTQEPSETKPALRKGRKK